MDAAGLVRALLRATCSEDAADALLGAMLEEGGAALAGDPLLRRARLLRVLLHLRPDGAYRRLLVREASGERGGAEPALPSATAWRLVVEKRCALSIDVNLGIVRAHGGDAGPTVDALPVEASPQAFDGAVSRELLLARAATHVLVLPLRAAGGAVEGMAAVEIDARSAMGTDGPWIACGERLQLLVDVAAPHLVALPLAPSAAGAPEPFLPVVGAATRPIVDVLRIFARQDETILVAGPTGAGKSRLARWCHAQSARAAAPFETIDLVTVPEELQLAELFGWRKGAFTGATRDAAGALARAEGGTLFLDEIDKLSHKAQAGLLRVLEERLYRPLGEGAGEKRADVRFVVGTNADLVAETRAGRFREDLFYRIHVLPVRLPALDQRKDEVAPWARFMATRRHADAGRAGDATIALEGEALLVARRWPGNLRQLDNVVRRAYALASVEKPEGDLVIEGRHVERALAVEPSSGDTGTVVERLREAAIAFVAAAERCAPDKPLDLDLADAFRGFVLSAAVARAGGRDEAFRLLGKAQLLAGRNHHKALRRELERVEALCRAVGEPVPASDEAP